MLAVSFQSDLPEAGCDEAGRGCLAGPVVAAAVILPHDFVCTEINDSKKLTRQKRDALRPLIERSALAWAVAFVPPDRIDAVNILNASFEAMEQAVIKLGMTPGFLAIDGNRFRTTLDIPYRCIVKGDATYANIAAASILAKTYRDDYMEGLAPQYPHYGWEDNKGYPTIRHRRAVAQYGLTPYHRKTFCGLPGQLELFQ